MLLVALCGFRFFCLQFNLVNLAILVCLPKVQPSECFSSFGLLPLLVDPDSAQLSTILESHRSLDMVLP